MTRFGQIRRGQHFEFEGIEWVRTKGTFARVASGEVPFSHWPFRVSTMVKPIKVPS